MNDGYERLITVLGVHRFYAKDKHGSMLTTRRRSENKMSESRSPMAAGHSVGRIEWLRYLLTSSKGFSWRDGKLSALTVPREMNTLFRLMPRPSATPFSLRRNETF